MGRSRGGLTIKIHVVVDANGLPVALKLTEGQAHDGRSAADMLHGLGPGQTLLAVEPMTAMHSAKRSQPRALGPTSSRCHGA
jgi:transposase